MSFFDSKALSTSYYYWKLKKEFGKNTDSEIYLNIPRLPFEGNVTIKIIL
jgi:hypothetical protein